MNNDKPWADRVSLEIGKAVLGQAQVVERLLVALLADGHVLPQKPSCNNSTKKSCKLKIRAIRQISD
jgi:hypothetical protein